MKTNTVLRKQIKAAEQDGYIKISYAQYITKYKRHQIEKLITEGYVSIKRVGWYILVHKEDLLAVRYKKAEIPFDNKHYQNMVKRVDKLVKKVELLEKILDLHYEPLILTEKELKALHNEASKLDIETASDIIRWSEILLRIDETHFSILDTSLGGKDSWKPFIELAYYNVFLSRRRQLVDVKKLSYKAYKQIKQSVLLYIREPAMIDSRVRLFRHTQVLTKAKKTKSYEKFFKKSSAGIIKEDLNIDDSQ